MPDHIFYETASGRVAKREFKSNADLQAAIAAETDPENEAHLQERLNKRLENKSAFNRAGTRGIIGLTRLFNKLASIPDSLIEGVSDLPEGELARQREHHAKERQIVMNTLDDQKALKEKFQAQEAADAAKLKEKERAANAARAAEIKTIRQRRKKV